MQNCEAELPTLKSISIARVGLVNLRDFFRPSARTFAANIPNESNCSHGARLRSYVSCLDSALLRILSVLCDFQSIAGQIEFQDDTVLHRSGHYGGCGHRILDDLFPLLESQITDDRDTAVFVAFG